MKRVYLLRHAKSSWDDPTLPDFERPLIVHPGCSEPDGEARAA